MEKPILFNTEMVKGIMEGRKTQTRRIIKKKYSNTDIGHVGEGSEILYSDRIFEIQNDVPEPVVNEDGSRRVHLTAYEEIKKPYEIGDVIYVRETWSITSMSNFDKKIKFLFKAEPNRELKEVIVSEKRYEDLIKFSDKNGWQPSLFMPKEAARTFLKVTGVKAERLQDITQKDIFAEGAPYDKEIYEMPCNIKNAGETYLRGCFRELWNSTINKKDIGMYDWDSDPWVWVIDFEKCH